MHDVHYCNDDVHNVQDDDVYDDFVHDVNDVTDDNAHDIFDSNIDNVYNVQDDYEDVLDDDDDLQDDNGVHDDNDDGDYHLMISMTLMPMR